MYGLAALEQAEKNPQQALQRAQQMPRPQPGQIPQDLMRVLAAQVATQKLAEAQRQMQAGMAGPQGTVAQQVEGELQQAAQADVAARVAPVMQQQSAQAGIAGLPAPNMGQQAFARGGVVGFADGGEPMLEAARAREQAVSGGDSDKASYERYMEMVGTPAAARVDAREARGRELLESQRADVPREQGILDVLANMGPVYSSGGQRISSVAGALRQGVEAKEEANAARKDKLARVRQAEFEQLGVLDEARGGLDKAGYDVTTAAAAGRSAVREQARKETREIELKMLEHGQTMSKAQFEATAKAKEAELNRANALKVAQIQAAARTAGGYGGAGASQELRYLTQEAANINRLLQARPKHEALVNDPNTEYAQLTQQLLDVNRRIRLLSGDAPAQAAPAPVQSGQAPATSATPSRGFKSYSVDPTK